MRDVFRNFVLITVLPLISVSACGSDVETDVQEQTSASHYPVIFPLPVSDTFPELEDIDTMIEILQNHGEDRLLAWFHQNLGEDLNTYKEIAIAGWIGEAYRELGDHEASFRWFSKGVDSRAIEYFGRVPDFFASRHSMAKSFVMTREKERIIAKVRSDSRWSEKIEQLVVSAIEEIESGDHSTVHELPIQQVPGDSTTETALGWFGEDRLTIDSWTIVDTRVGATVWGLSVVPGEPLKVSFDDVSFVLYADVRIDLRNIDNDTTLQNALLKMEFSFVKLTLEEMATSAPKRTTMILDPTGNFEPALTPAMRELLGGIQ